MSSNVPDLRRVYDAGEARKILREHGLTFSHAAGDSRYISKRIGYGICEPYDGRYGKGLIVRRAETRIDKNPVHSIVEYWLEERVNGKAEQGLDSGCVRRGVHDGAVAKNSKETCEACE